MSEFEIINSNEDEFSKATGKKPKGWWNTEKEFNVTNENNKAYWESFKLFRWGESPNDKQVLSMRQYKSSILNFMQFVDKDIITITKDDLKAFLDLIPNKVTRTNKQAHIKSILEFTVKKNVMGAMGRVSKNVLLLILLL